MFTKRYAFFDAPCDIKLNAESLYNEKQEYGLIGFAGAKRDKDRVTGTGGFNPADNASCVISFYRRKRAYDLPEMRRTSIPFVSEPLSPKRAFTTLP